MNAPHAAAGPATGATRALAAFASSLHFDDLPLAVVEKAKTCVLDTLGCCLFGAKLTSVQKLAAMAIAENPDGHARLMGFAYKTSPALAALVNAAGAHAFQLDEIHVRATLHPGSLAVPAVFALAENNPGVKGRTVLTALVAAYETGIRIGIATQGNMFARGYHNQGTTGAFVAAAGAGRVLALSEDDMVHALGLAGSQAAGLMAVQEGAMAKGFHSGRAAQSGVYAALLARSGYTGIPNVLEAPYGGFMSTLAGNYAAGALTAGLGREWETLRVGFKPAPASNGSITAMSALDNVMREYTLCADDIVRVAAHVSTNTLHHCGFEYERDKVQGVLAAQMNLRYGLAIMALERKATAAQFREENLWCPQILDFIRRINVEVEPRYDDAGGEYRLACHIEVTCRNGRRHSGEVLYRKGSAEVPMTTDELRAKFLDLATPTVGADRAGRIAELVDRLESVPDITALSALLAA